MGRPQFDESFECNRVETGEVIPSAELGRRMCHELQIPQKFSTRIYKAISRVIADAIEHGEGIRVQDLGVLKLKPFKSTTVKLANGRVVPRPSMFKITFDTTEKGDLLLQKISKDKYES